MIETTDEMVTVVDQALTAAAGTGTGEARAAVRAVLALVERDYDVSPKLLAVEHRAVENPWWNHTMSEYNVRCACGEEFAGYAAVDASDRLADHIEAQDGGR